MGNGYNEDPERQALLSTNSNATSEMLPPHKKIESEKHKCSLESSAINILGWSTKSLNAAARACKILSCVQHQEDGALTLRSSSPDQGLERNRKHGKGEVHPIAKLTTSKSRHSSSARSLRKGCEQRMCDRQHKGDDQRDSYAPPQPAKQMPANSAKKHPGQLMCRTCKVYHDIPFNPWDAVGGKYCLGNQESLQILGSVSFRYWDLRLWKAFRHSMYGTRWIKNQGKYQGSSTHWNVKYTLHQHESHVIIKLVHTKVVGIDVISDELEGPLPSCIHGAHKSIHPEYRRATRNFVRCGSTRHTHSERIRCDHCPSLWQMSIEPTIGVFDPRGVPGHIVETTQWIDAGTCDSIGTPQWIALTSWPFKQWNDFEILNKFFHKYDQGFHRRLQDLRSR